MPRPAIGPSPEAGCSPRRSAAGHSPTLPSSVTAIRVAPVSAFCAPRDFVPRPGNSPTRSPIAALWRSRVCGRTGARRPAITGCHPSSEPGNCFTKLAPLIKTVDRHQAAPALEERLVEAAPWRVATGFADYGDGACGDDDCNSVLRRTAPIGRYRGTKPCDRAVSGEGRPEGLPDPIDLAPSFARRRSTQAEKLHWPLKQPNQLFNRAIALCRNAG